MKKIGNKAMTPTEKSQKRQSNLKKVAESLGYKSWSTVQTDIANGRLKIISNKVWHSFKTIR